MGGYLDPRQQDDILVLERVTSIFSVAGCILIFATFIFSKKFRRPVNRLIFWASIGNLLMNIATLMSVTPLQVANPKTSPLCRFQGFLVQVFLPADAFWNLSMAINVYLTVFRNWSAGSLRKLEPYYIAVNYGITTLIAVIYLFINETEGKQRGTIYGPATLWCWIDSKWEDYRIWLCYVPAWFAILAIFVIYGMAWRHIRHRRRALTAEFVGDETTDSASRNESSTKPTEIRITTELSRHSFVSPVVAPNMPTDEPPARRSKDNTYVFNPFRLDPNCNLGFSPYEVTISRGHEATEVDDRRAAASEADAAAWAYTQTALLYFASLLITWLPSSMNRVYSLVYTSDINFAFSVMAGLVLPLMGFWNAVIYLVTSWDAVKALCSDLAHGRCSELGLPRRKRKCPDSSVGGPWIEINADNLTMPNGGSEMGRVPSQETGLEESSTRAGSVAMAWPHHSKHEMELNEQISSER